jgi:hypothetical protein
MNTMTLSVILVIAAVLIGAVLVMLISGRRNRSKNLRQKYGTEYDHTLKESKNRRAAEDTLREREKHVSNLNIRTLDEKELNEYHQKWIKIQANFVNDPAKSVEDGNQLISAAMIARGFPINNFEQRAADISVLYPDFVTNYRSAEAIALKNRTSGASTEELRQAMVYYRALFDELLGSAEMKEEIKVADSAEEKIAVH